jgi:spore coat protein H
MKAKPAASAGNTEKTPTNGEFMEDKRVYEKDEVDSITNFYVTILHSGSNDLNFYGLNHWYDDGNILKESPKLDVIIQVGDETGPTKGSLGAQENLTNASIEIRGNSSKVVAQKSYKIKLSDNAGLWNGQSVINLNKHIDDITRVRNKLSFDYFKDIPNFTSLRTQFVNLHIKDLTGETPDTEYVDYGLFTQIEQPNKRFLNSHGLHPNSNLYKANLFEFFEYPDQLKLATDPEYNKNEFESVLQIKGSEDHTNLLAMLEAVNDFEHNINDVVDQYFNRENYLTWLAVNILLGNIDTDAQNYYLYNPLNSEKFYFLPWDYDAAWGQQKEESTKIKGFTAKWQLGISNYWGSVLHQRFFKDPENVEDLSAKLEELSTVFSEQRTEEYLEKYYPIVSEYINRSPDLDDLPFRLEKFEESFWNLKNIPEENKQTYYDNLENPMPVYLGTPEMVNENYLFQWDPSYDLQGDDLTYDFQVSQSPNFSEAYVNRQALSGTSIEIPAKDLKKGKNYWRVVIKDSKGNTQEAFDRLEIDNVYYNGLLEFHVE